MKKINWNTSKKTDLFFEDLDVGDTFRLANGAAVYMKVSSGRGLYFTVSNEYENEGMLELATGKVFAASESEVVLIDVDITINAEKPEIYGK